MGLWLNKFNGGELPVEELLFRFDGDVGCGCLEKVLAKARPSGPLPSEYLPADGKKPGRELDCPACCCCSCSDGGPPLPVAAVFSTDRRLLLSCVSRLRSSSSFKNFCWKLVHEFILRRMPRSKRSAAA